MNLSIYVSGLTAATLVASAWPVPRQESKGAAEDPVADAGKMFVELCIGCHQAPDVRFPTDRAWLNQVSDTA